MVIEILILVFLFIIIYKFGWVNNKEGLENAYQPYDINSSNALILAQQNAGNIEFIKSQIDKLNTFTQTVTDLSNNYVSLNDQVQKLVQQQADYGESLNGGSSQPLSVTGIE